MRVSVNIVNVNVFALAFMIAFSCFIMIFNSKILKFLVFLSNFRRALALHIDHWIQGGVWQLHRQAYQGEGCRDWEELENWIPLMEKGIKLIIYQLCGCL